MNSKTISLGIFGFGCVGQGLYDILQNTKGIQAKVSRFCVKDKTKKRTLPAHYFTYDRNDILNDASIDVIVELIDDADAAFEIVSTAMKNGKGVVTANKKMVAEHFEELIELQQKHKVSFLYEASTCASIPILRNLEEYYDNDLVNSIEGIFNGSTNFILTKIYNQGTSYPDALKEAQQLGFAETDPSLDVKGFDPKYKLCIITAHAFGLFPNPDKVFNYGIPSLSKYDIQYAKEKGYKIKLVAKSKKMNGKLMLWVIPQFIHSGNYLYYIDNEFNGVIIEGAFSEKQAFVGKGAGGHPTGSAVLSDISALTYQYKYEYKKRSQNNIPSITNSFSIEIYLRYKKEEDVSHLQFESISEKYISNEYSYVVGTINISALIHSPLLDNPDVFFAQTINEKIELK